MTQTLHLPDVTLCVVSTREPELGALSLQRSMKGVRYASVIMVSPPDFTVTLKDVSKIVIARFASIREYSAFLLEDLSECIKSSHVLLVQWDGFVVNPTVWQADFLQYDYIGAVWPQFDDGMNVGNGGFSLRSRRLLRALQGPDIELSHPEDVCICRINRRRLESKYGIRFAPEDVARQFSFEREKPSRTTFGFHGLFAFPQIMPDDELLEFVQKMPPAILGGRDTLDLCKALLLAPSPLRLNVIDVICSRLPLAHALSPAWMGIRAKAAMQYKSSKRAQNTIAR